jgi:UDP-glucose 4-epimerase
MMRLIITGASGFLGKNMLLGAPRNWEIVALYNNANIEGFLRDRGLNNVKTERCDLANPQEVAALAERIGPEFDACLYLAANTVVPLSVENPIFDLQTNTISVINFLENFRGNRFIYLSSGAVYDSLSGQVDPGKKFHHLYPTQYPS